LDQGCPEGNIYLPPFYLHYCIPPMYRIGLVYIGAKIMVITKSFTHNIQYLLHAMPTPHLHQLHQLL
jgi:hypothetical protein